MNQIEITTCVRADGMHEVKLIDAADTMEEVAVNSLADGVIMAHASGAIDDAGLAAICAHQGVLCPKCGHGDLDCEDAWSTSELIRKQCAALDDLFDWFARERYRLIDAQISEWETAATEGMYGRNPYDEEWSQAVDDLTEMRKRWSNDKIAPIA